MTRLVLLVVVYTLYIGTVSGQWLSWSPFSECSRTCNPGDKTRSRVCGGDIAFCNGQASESETETCFERPCPIPELSIAYTPWSECTGYCGEGKRMRTKYCISGCDQFRETEEESCSEGECRMETCPVINNEHFDCNFEDRDSCAWAGDDSNMWKVGQYTPSSSTGPNVDRTHNKTGCGHFVYFEASYPAKPDDKALFTSKCVIAPETEQCLSFHVSMYSHSPDRMGSLKVKYWAQAGDGTNDFHDVWYHEGALTNSPSEWKQVNIDLPLLSRSIFYITIEATRGSSFSSDIAIDDITLTNGLCSGQVDGNWGKFEPYSPCTATCGDLGLVFRKRDCNSPAPRNNGKLCDGSPLDFTLCKDIGIVNDPCPVNGNWSTWSTWTTCSATCGTGEMSRQRECNNPAPAHTGALCTDSDGNETQEDEEVVAPCNVEPCQPPIDGVWEEWTVDACSLDCGGGITERTRVCTPPQFGGQECVRTDTSLTTADNRVELISEPCNEQGCDADGVWTDWTNTTVCSVTCEIGSITQSRSCEGRTGSGADCVGSPTQTIACNTGNDCPVDGVWEEWTVDACSLDCGGGITERRRVCTPPQFGGQECLRTDTSLTTADNRVELISEPCNEHSCDGMWTNWANVAGAECSVTCASGLISQERSCEGGNACVGDTTREEPCDTMTLCPVNGGWSEFVDNSTCTASCNGGSKVQVRACDNPVRVGDGEDCMNSTTRTVACNVQPCPTINGTWTDWAPVCEKTCDNTALLPQTRQCTTTEIDKEPVCVGDETRSHDCGSTACPIDGGFTEWTDWSVSTCTETCGEGKQERFRDCTNPEPANGGAPCQGDRIEPRTCNLGDCPVLTDGMWTDWSPVCEKTCENVGTTAQTRECTNPSPANGGADCPGVATRDHDCGTGLCPIDGGFTEWTDWSVSTCTETCGEGKQERFRDCTNPEPANEGAPCQGDRIESRTCNLGDCPVLTDGMWTDWSPVCEKTCENTGTTAQTRECTNPAPANGGAGCTGEATRDHDCGTAACPIDGGFTDWTDWSGDACSETCGDGSQSRFRDCTNPTPENGGALCQGSRIETKTCNLGACGDANDCSFEADGSSTLCNFMVSGDSPPRWFLNSGTTTTADTGPSNDNTLNNANGFYLLFEDSSSDPIGGLTFPVATQSFSLADLAAHADHARCLEFQFHMFLTDGPLTADSTLGTFAIVSVSNDDGAATTLYTQHTETNTDNNWKQVRVDLPATGSMYLLQFTASASTGNTGKVDKAIDDIKFYDTPCSSVA